MDPVATSNLAGLPARRAKDIHAFFKLLRKAMSRAKTKRIHVHTGRSQTPPPLSQPEGMSEFSDAAVKNSAWCSKNFLLGAGMVIIQPSTNKLVLLFRSDRKTWFLPKGRKDIGESIEQTALREAYEESGYKAEFLPLFNPCCALASPEHAAAIFKPNTEPIFTSLTSWKAGKDQNGDHIFQGEYFTFWYVGQIGPDAVHHRGTGMDNEQCFSSHLVTYEEAMTKVWGTERRVVEYAWAVYLSTLEDGL